MRKKLTWESLQNSQQILKKPRSARFRRFHRYRRRRLIGRRRLIRQCVSETKKLIKFIKTILTKNKEDSYEDYLRLEFRKPTTKNYCRY